MLTDAQLKNIMDEYEKQFKEIQFNSLAAGAKAICKTILDKIENDTMTDAEKLKEIKRFCSVALTDKNTL